MRGKVFDPNAWGEGIETAIAAGEPYFGRELVSYQGDLRHKCFGMLARQIEIEEPIVLEVGCWAGMSLLAWHNAFEGRARLIAVDNWEPYWPDDIGALHKTMNEVAKSGEILSLFLYNMKSSGIASRVHIRRGDSRIVLEAMESDSVDLVYIDGDHRYECIVVDIRNAMRLIRIGGIICGDDLEVQLHEVSNKDEHENACYSGKDFLESGGYHPGVTQAVGEIFGPVSCFDGVWAMQRLSADNWGPVK